ncbi:MAG TPA: response regulator transcription factor, partial [Opitutaceae bacterium]
LSECKASRVLEAADLATARATLSTEVIDLVLLDLDLPDGSGFDLIDEQLQRPSRPKIVVVSAHCEDYTMLRVERLGLEGFVDKRNGGVVMLTEAIAALRAGRRYHSPYLLERKQAMREDPACFTKVLSDWEIQILSLIGQSLDDSEIGKQLSLSAATVQMHRSQIMRKLDISGTPKLIRYALEKGIASWPRHVNPIAVMRSGAY